VSEVPLHRVLWEGVVSEVPLHRVLGGEVLCERGTLVWDSGGKFFNERGTPVQELHR
jgi:uncharacterized protein (UPF0248 family)